MTKTLTLRNVPDEVATRLRVRAQRNGRSMQAELLEIVESAVLDQESLLGQLRAFRQSLKRSMTLEEIQQAISEGRP